MKKIGIGNYIENYKGQEISVHKFICDGVMVWVGEINGADAGDHHNTKKLALLAAKYMIDNPSEYDLILKDV